MHKLITAELTKRRSPKSKGINRWNSYHKQFRSFTKFIEYLIEEKCIVLNYVVSKIEHTKVKGCTMALHSNYNEEIEGS